MKANKWLMFQSSCAAFGMVMATVAMAVAFQADRAECSARLLTHAERSSAIGGVLGNHGCQVVGTGSCPSGTPPTPEIECTTRSVAGCLVGYCHSCNAAPGTTYKKCFTFPDVNCDPWEGGGVFGASTCGTYTERGCSLSYIPVTSCSCPGAPYAPTSWDCVESDCTDDL